MKERMVINGETSNQKCSGKNSWLTEKVNQEFLAKFKKKGY